MPPIGSLMTNLASRRVPAGRARLDGLRTCAVLVMLREDCQALDPGEHREGGDGAGASEGPARLEAELPRSHARLDALADVQAAEHVFVGVELDRCALRWAEEPAIVLVRLPIEERASNSARLVGFDLTLLVRLDRAEERDHRADRRAARDRAEEPYLRLDVAVPAQNTPADVVFEVEAAGGEIAADEGARLV